MTKRGFKIKNEKYWTLSTYHQKSYFLQFLKDNQSLSKEDLTKYINVYGMLLIDREKLLQNYLDSHMPGFRHNDPLPDISPLLAARDPGTLFNFFNFLHLTKLYETR